MSDTPAAVLLPSDRVKHLEFIQATVSRLAGNSFLMKGWTVTLVAALFALSAKEAQHWFSVIALLPAFCFWGLDAYFLRQERLFRKLFTAAARPDSTVPMYSMETQLYEHEVATLASTTRSKTLLPFYLPIVAAAILATVMTWIRQPDTTKVIPVPNHPVAVKQDVRQAVAIPATSKQTPTPAKIEPPAPKVETITEPESTKGGAKGDNN